LPGETLAPWVRFALLGVVIGLVLVFVVAARINPYRSDGTAQQMATHLQLGLPECNFVTVTGMPCPSCGLTTSFALTIRADAANAARANWVGMLLACLCLAVIPWGVASALVGRALFVRSLERTILGVISVLFVLLLLRWAWVLSTRSP
jgi:hypothetical protein